MVGSVVDLKLQQRFNLNYESQSYRRLIGNKEVVIHCHHYNARLQNIIEGTHKIDGKEIIRNSAEEVFTEYIRDFFLLELHRMPSEWIAALHHAAIAVDAELIMQLIGEIPLEQSSLARGLTTLVRDYCFDEIIALTENR